MSTPEVLLARLDKVKRTGDGVWQARCPAHDDKTPSLRVKLLEDGRILINDFGGCGAVAVLEAIGLSLGDLYPSRLPEHRYDAVRRPYMPSDVLEILRHEAQMLLILGSDLEHSLIDGQGLRDSVERIEAIARMAYGRD